MSVLSVTVLIIGFELTTDDRHADAQSPSPKGATQNMPASRGRSAARSTATFTPTDQYETKKIEGWTVLVEKKFLASQSVLATRVLAQLRSKLAQIRRRLPAGPLSKLRQIRIWVEEQEPHHPCMVYHPNVEWLEEHGMNPDKANCVEISNARKFLEWESDQPFMVLHELAHGYHDQFLDGGYGNAAIKRAFDTAMKAKLYESVPYVRGGKLKAYATSNPMEYFAESSESFFGVNDYYPFERTELAKYDPATFALVQKLWQVN
jgi:hypothetical protein